VLGIVDEVFGVEKSLFVGGENKFLPADETLQDPI
jgi:hypothetical protein